MTLATQLNQFKAQQKQSTTLATATAGNTGGKKGNDPAKDFYPGTQVETWRGKYDGPSKMGSNGRLLHWCKHHKHPEGFWDGLYVQHLEKDCKKAGNQNGGATSGNTPATPAAKAGTDGTTTTPLQLQQNLKKVLCTNLCMSPEDMDKLFEKASEN